MPETQGFLTKDGISGLVLSNKGKPLISANVSIINPTTFKLVQSITDNNGWFEAIISEQECDENDYSVTAIAKDGNKKNEIFLANRFGENLKLFAKAKPSFINPGFNYFTDASEPINLDGLLLSQTIKEIKNRNKDKNDAKFNEMRKASLLNPTKKLLDIIAEIKPYSIVGNKIIFAGNLNSINAQTGARFVIDGVLESDDISIVNSINVSDIEDIRIITDPSEILNYTSFANGIIEITTKKGKKPIEDNSSLKHTSKRVYKVTGKFEMPDYSAEKLIGQDNRTTLYWEPVVKINNSGETEVSFYNSDVKGSFTGTLEGIVNGEPVSIVFLYNVK
jgi:hypothetical protein